MNHMSYKKSSTLIDIVSNMHLNFDKHSASYKELKVNKYHASGKTLL